MSTLKEAAESKVSITLKPKESLLLSLSRDIFSFSILLLLIYVSKDSSWWTLVTGLLFLVFCWLKLSNVLGKQTTTFKSKEAAIEYLNNLDL